MKAAALKLAIPVFQPERLQDRGVTEALHRLAPDLCVVAAYGKILPAGLLTLPRLGMINVHASLLPRWRGASPVHRAIMAGDTETGITIMRVVQALDAGPVLARISTPIGSDITSEELEARLSILGADLLMETISALARGPVTESPQDETHVTYAPRLERRESALDWNRPCGEVHNRIRGLQPWPLAAAVLQERRVLLLRSSPLPAESHAAAPGTVIRVEPDALVIATAPGAIRLRELQLEGRQPVTVSDFLNGRRVVAGERFEPWRPPGA